MANEQLIDQVIDPAVAGQVESLKKMLTDLDVQMSSNIKSANQLNAITGNSKSFKEYQVNATAVTLATEKIQQAQNKTAETTVKLDEVRAKAAQAEATRQAKAIADQQKRDAAQAVSDAKQIAAAEAKAAKLQAIEDKRKASVQFKEPDPNNPYGLQNPYITQEPTPVVIPDVAPVASKNTEAIAAENAALLEQQKALSMLSVEQRQNIELLLTLQAERTANTAELKTLNTATAEGAERAVFLTAEQLRLKAEISGVTVELNRQTKQMLSAQGATKELEQSVLLLRNAYETLTPAERNSAHGQKQLAELQALDAEYKALKVSTGDTTKEVGAYERAIAKATSGTQLATQAITIGTRSIVRMIVQFALFGVVLQAAEWLYKYIAALNIFNPVATEAEQRQKALTDAFSSSDYSKGLESMEKLKTDLDLASKGFSDSSSVVDEYNNTIGKTFGYVDDLNAAQQGFIDNSADYIKVLYLEAAAQINMAEAAKFAAETEVKNQKLRNEIEDLNKDRTLSLTKRAKALADIKIASDNQEIKDNEKREDEFLANSLKANEDFYTKLDELKNKHGVKGGEGNKASDIDTLKNQIDNDRLEREKIIAQKQISDEKLAYKTRFEAADAYYNASLEQAKNNEQLATKGIKLSADQKLKIEGEYQNQVLQLTQAHTTQIQSLRDKQYKQDQEILKNNIEKQRDLFKQVSEDPNQSYDMKLIALDVYNKKSQELIKANYKEQITEAGKNSESIKLAEQKRDADLLKLENETAVQRLRIQKENLAKLIEASKESEQEQLETLDNGAKLALRALNKAKTDKENVLDEQRRKGKISEKKYTDELLLINDQYNIDRIKQEIVTQQTILAIKEGQRDATVSRMTIDGATPVEISKFVSGANKGIQPTKDKISDLQDNLGDANTKLAKDSNKTDYDDGRIKREIEQKATDATVSAIDSIDKLRQQAFENEIARLEKLSQQIDDNANAEKDQVNNSIASNKTKARQIALIDKQTAVAKKNIQDQENKEKTKAAKAEKEATIAKIIATGALAVVSALTTQPIWLGIVLAAITGAAVAVELATAIATPLPTFAKGGITAGGKLIWGEAGMERATLPDGSVRYSTGAEVANFPRGTVITPHMELMRLIKPDNSRYAGGSEIGWREVVEAIKQNKPEKKRNLTVVHVNTEFESYKKRYLSR